MSTCNSINLILTIIILKVLLRQLLSLTKLIKARIVCILKIAQIIVIYENDKKFYTNNIWDNGTKSWKLQ